MKYLAIILIVGMFSAPSFADDIVLGKTYDIEEVNLLDWIKARLAKLESSGQLKKLRDDWKSTAKKRVNRPLPVKGLSKTVKASVHYIDPSFVVDQAILDHTGRMIAAPGTRINPFDMVNMSNHLIFIDGDDEEQVAWAKRMYDKYQTRVKTILVSGSPIELMKTLERRVYFDQHGVLSKKFKLEHVPAIVSQDNKRLRVAEVLAN